MLDNEERISKQRALELWDSGAIDTFEVGTTKGLQSIHYALFHDLKGFDAGNIRTVTLSKGDFRFANPLYLNEILKVIEQMPEETYDQILEKYVEMNVAHPFLEGNGRSSRMWLDQMLKKNLQMCIDWQKVNKLDYLNFMKLSPLNDKYIKELLFEALTDRINDREVFMKGIDQSYFYEDLYSVRLEELDRHTRDRQNDLER